MSLSNILKREYEVAFSKNAQPGWVRVLKYGVINPAIAKTNWSNSFNAEGNSTKVEVVMTFQSEADIQQLIDMGFQQGFTMAHENLDAVLAK